MKWMNEDFDKESKRKVAESKKIVRGCRKNLLEKQMT
jgi:hypothetical protein